MTLEDQDLERTMLQARPAIDGSDIRKLGADPNVGTHLTFGLVEYHAADKAKPGSK